MRLQSLWEYCRHGVYCQFQEKCGSQTLRRHVPSGLAGCCSFPPSPPVNAGHRRWLWSAECYLVSQISPAPKWDHILKLLGELEVKHQELKQLTDQLSPSNTRSSTNTILPQQKGLWTAVFGLTRLITIFFYWIKKETKKNKEKTIQVKFRSEKVFLYLGGASTKISVSQSKPT